MRRALVSLVLLVGCRGSSDGPVVGRGDPAASGASAAGGAGSAGSAAPARTGLAEVGPHPDFPTPRSAGTERVFLLEEPDRGPPVDLAYTPPPGPFTVTAHAHCELTAGTVACGAPAPALPARWRVHRAGARVVRVERLFLDGRVWTQYAFEHAPDGALRRRIELDAYGRVVEELRFTGDRYAARQRDGGNGLAGCGAMGFSLDAAGHVRELRCLQWNGAPMRDTESVAITRFTRDARGLIVEKTRFDAAGTPTIGTDDIHALGYERDAAGRITRVTQAAVGGAAVADGAGCFAYGHERTPGGDLAALTCLDANGRPRAKRDGVATIASQYDARGCLLQEASLDVADRPVVDLRGVHARAYVRSERCEVREIACAGVDGSLVPCGPREPARRVVARDDVGRQISEQAFNARGQTTGDVNYDAFELRWSYDERDRVVAESCHGLRGTRIACGGTGAHVFQQKHDDAGRVIERSFLDTEQRPTLSLGAARMQWRYDNYDHLVEIQSFDATGAPIEVLGSVIMRQYYDERHRLFARLMFDAQARPVGYTGCYTGITCPEGPWHALRVLYDGPTARHNQFFDTTGQLLHTVDCTTAPCLD